VIFNLSNILVVGAISVAGMGVGFPIGVGLALVVGVIWNYIVNPQGNPWLLFLGVALIVGAIVVDAIAYRRTPSAERRRGQGGCRRQTSGHLEGHPAGIVGGVLMGMFYPLVEIGKSGEKGLGPYAVGFVFGLGVLASVFVYNLYFMRFPIEGPRLSFGDYLKGSWWVRVPFVKSEPNQATFSTHIFVIAKIHTCLSTHSLGIIQARAVSQDLFQAPSPGRAPEFRDGVRNPRPCRTTHGSTEE
jgi:hypothetical protein